MHQIIFVAAEDSAQAIEWDENPADSFPCMTSQQFHRDARAQLYALATGAFLAEAAEMEYLAKTLSDDGPYLYQFTAPLIQALAQLNEDQVEALANHWLECEEIENLDLSNNDLHDFIFQLIHFCQLSVNDGLNIYVYSDD
ncbi:MAG: hypothetical protein KUG79_03490 [Pseudomonadales bacterium]|nr:hypothetical protein [Pseudomonadales bacterium]